MLTYVLTDLDGTLLRSDATLSDFSRSLLTRALEDGHVISYATARSYTSSMNVVSSVPWRYPVVLYNGALLYDPVNRSVVDGHFLSESAALEIIELGRAHGVAPLWFALDAEDREIVLHESMTRTGDRQFLASRPGDPRFREQPSLTPLPGMRTLMLTYIGYERELEPLRRAAAEKFGTHVHMNMMPDRYIQDHYFLEFSDAQANKREGLKLWARLVGACPEQVVVYGDNLNDTGLFEAAGRKVAVANAHPVLLGQADRVAASNDEDGVACDLERELFRGSSGLSE